MKTLVLFLLLTSSALAATPKPTIFLIPGAASSGDRIYLDKISWPLKFIHGDKYFGKLQKVLKKEKVNAKVCPKEKDKDTRTLEERAEDCAQEILKSQGGECTQRSVSLYGHSMGGLIARLLAQDPRVRNCIQSVTSIATPHRGTPISDFSVDHVDKDDYWGDIIKFIGMSYHRIRYLPQLRVDRTGYDPALFQAQDTPDNPDVAYYSYSASMDKMPDPAMEIMRKIISEELVNRGLDRSQFGIKNDGVVPAYSMVWGQHLAHLDVHHMASSCSGKPKIGDFCELTLKSIVPHLRGVYRALQGQR